MVYNTMYPIMQNPYVSRDTRKVVKKKEDEESSQSARSSQTETEQEQPQRQIDQYERKNVYQRLEDSKQAQVQAKTALEANIKNSTINIAQIIKDFKNTAAAIATPPELNDEVNTYLALVESQVQKDDPNVKIIKSNLKNASSLLDSYITETLQRPSKVVENWLDALFLQRINFKFDSDDINAQFLVKFPNGKKIKNTDDADDAGEIDESEETSEETATAKTPQDPQLKSLFIKAKKYAFAKDYKKAMENFKLALDRAIEVIDNDTQSKVLYEIGKIYDKNDYLTQALTSYNESLAITTDSNVKTQAHYSMAQIYDDIAEFEPAINHYLSSISYAGENENLSAQSASLTKIGNIYSDKYENNAFEFYTEAKLIAQETKDHKTKGYVSSSIANAYTKFNEPQNALKSYFEACKEYQEADSPLKVATTYRRAADVMKDYNNPQKAKSLLQKALSNAQQTDDTKLINDLVAELSEI